MHVPVCPSILLDIIVASVACTGEIMDIQESVCSELSRSVQTGIGALVFAFLVPFLQVFLWIRACRLYFITGTFVKWVCFCVSFDLTIGFKRLRGI